jgi:hypothetical protein
MSKNLGHKMNVRYAATGAAMVLATAIVPSEAQAQPAMTLQAGYVGMVQLFN